MTPSIPRFFRIYLLFIVIGSGILLSCGGDGDSGTNPVLERMEGRWEASEFRVTAKANASQTFELVEAGGQFLLDIQASGRYAATLTLGGQGGTESGRIEIQGSRFTQYPENPPGDPVSGTWSMPDDDTLILDGDTEFDFDFDGEEEPATGHIELFRR